MSEIDRIRSVIDRMEAEGWEPRYSATMVGSMQQWRIDWTRKSPVFTHPRTLPRATLIQADTGKEIRP